MTEKGIARTNSPVGAQDKEQEGTESFLSGRDCGRLPTGPNTPCAEDPLPARPGAGGGLCEARPTLLGGCTGGAGWVPPQEEARRADGRHGSRGTRRGSGAAAGASS